MEGGCDKIGKTNHKGGIIKIERNVVVARSGLFGTSDGRSL
jgi:hypothetical protein